MFVAARTDALVQHVLAPRGCSPASASVIAHAIISETLPNHLWLSHPGLVSLVMIGALTASLGLRRSAQIASILVPVALVFVSGTVATNRIATELDERLPLSGAAQPEFVTLDAWSIGARFFEGPVLSLPTIEAGFDLQTELRRRLEFAAPDHLEHGSYNPALRTRLTVAPAAGLSGREIRDLLREASLAGAQELDWITADPEDGIELTSDPRTWVLRLSANQYVTHSVLYASRRWGRLFATIGADAARLRLEWSDPTRRDSVVFRGRFDLTAASVRSELGVRREVPIVVVLEIADDATAASLLSAMLKLQDAGFTTALNTPYRP